MEPKFDQIARNHASSIHNLEVQVGQLGNALSIRNQGNLPSNTESNPREQLKAITLRSGKELAPPTLKQKGGKEGEEASSNMEEKQQEETMQQSKSSPPLYEPKVPFPQRLKKQQVDQQFSKFLEIFKKLQINIPFAEALPKMPQFAKFLKDIITNKRKWDDEQTISLTENCSSIITNKMPTKLKNPRSFIIPCVVGDLEFPKCLCDLGAGINLMSLSIFRKLGLGEVKPTSMLLQLAGHLIKRPYGIIEDVLVKVEKFIFPVDFMVLEFEEEKECSLILGRPFLNTGRALVDVYEGKLTLRIGDDKVEFNMFKTMKYPLEKEACMRIDVIEECVNEVHQEERSKDESSAAQVSVAAATRMVDAMLGDNDRYTCSLPKPELLIRNDNPTPPSIEKLPQLELNPLPNQLKVLWLE